MNSTFFNARNLQRGDIIFVRSTSPLSKLIRLFDRGKWSHVAIALDSTHVLDARFIGGVKIRHFDFDDYEVVRYNGYKSVNINNALTYLNFKYDVIRFIWYGFRLGKIWDNPNKFICSELVAEYLNIPHIKNLSPNEQYKYFKAVE